MNKTLRYFSLWYLQAVGVIAAAGAGFAVGALLEIRSSGAGLLSTYLSSVPIMVLLLSLIMPYTLSRSYAEEALCFGAARREIFRGLETATLLYALVMLAVCMAGDWLAHWILPPEELNFSSQFTASLPLLFALLLFLCQLGLLLGRTRHIWYLVAATIAVPTATFVFLIGALLLGYEAPSLALRQARPLLGTASLVLAAGMCFWFHSKVARMVVRR